MRHLYYVRVGCCIGAMLTPGFFHFSASTPLCKVSPVRAELRIEFTVRGVQGSQSALVLFFLAQLIAYRDAQFCMHLVVENKCVNLYLHLSILRGCVDTQLVLCVIATRVWFIRCFHTTKKI